MPTVVRDPADYTLCDVCGPWLHTSTPELSRMDDEGRSALAGGLESAYPSLKVGQWLAFVNSVVEHSRNAVTNLEKQDRTTLANLCGVSLDLHRRGPTTGTITQSVRAVLKHGLIPLVVLDLLLHFSHPGHEARVFEQDQTRPRTDKSYAIHFALHHDLYKVLKDAAAGVSKAAEAKIRKPKDASTSKETKKTAVLRRCSYLNSSTVPGWRQAYNHVQATFLLFAFLRGFSVLTKDDIRTVSLQNAQLFVPEIKRVDIEKTITNPDPAGLFASLAVAILHGGYFLTREVAYAHHTWNPGHSFYTEWVAKGNRHHLDRDCPPGRLDKKWWELLVSAAAGTIQPEDIPSLFYADPEVKAIAFPPEIPAAVTLGFASDANLVQPLIPFDDDVVIEYIDSDVDNAVEPELNKDGEAKAEKKKAKTSASAKKKEQPAKREYNIRARNKSAPEPKQTKAGSAKQARPAGKRVKKTEKNPMMIETHPDICFVAAHFIKPMEIPEQALLEARKRTRLLDFNLDRPTIELSLKLPFQAPTSVVGECVTYLYEYTPFENFSSDAHMLPEILASQPLNDENTPLFLLPSARDPDPDIRPSDTQSFFFVTTKAQIATIPDRDLHLLMRHRAILLLGDDDEAPIEFDERLLSRFRDPRKLCHIQDIGLVDPDDGDDNYSLRAGRLVDLLPSANRPVLNAIHHPLAHRGVSCPPRIDLFTSIETALTHLAGHQHLPEAQTPWGILRWALVSTKGARSATHADIVGTAIEQVVGLKSVSIAVPRVDRFEDNGHEGDWLSRHAINNWFQSQCTARPDVFRWETFLLRPGMSFWMPHGTRHFIMTLEDSVAQGVHTINTPEAAVAVGVLVTLTICDGDATNEPTEPVRWLFVRLFIFWAEKILSGVPVGLNHFPDVLTREGLLDVLYLASYVVLYPSLRPEEYPLAQNMDDEMGDALPMLFDRYSEYEYALWMVVRVAAHLDNPDEFELKAYQFDDQPVPDVEHVVHAQSMRELLNESMLTMACCIARYRTSWLESSSADAKGFTPHALQQQLRRCLAAYNSMHRHRKTSKVNRRSPPLFDLKLQDCELTSKLDSRIKSSDPFDFFLPWDLLALPGSDRCFDIVFHVAKGKKRARSIDEDEEEQEHPAKRIASSI